MGKIEKLKSTRKCTICYWITIVVLLGLSIGFLVAYVLEKNKSDDSSSSITEPSVGTSPLTPAPTLPPDLLLPETIVPTHYALTIEPNHQTDQFSGDVTIDLVIAEPTNVIKIHAYQLSISNEKLINKSGATFAIKSVDYDKDKQFHVIELNDELPENTYHLSLSFAGSLIGKIIGFYKSNYTNTDNQIKEFSATKFEPTYARQAFPCFDEPQWKATFSIAIIHDKNLNAISNGAQIDRTDVDDMRVKTVFKKTVPMSTYLVAYVISDFKYTESSTTRGKKVRVFSRPDQLDQTKYALSTAIKVLEYYENYFEIDYPLEKLDLVALPVFVSGAMENWGIITFRETNLLYSDDRSSTSEMKRVAAVIGHELAHMWFGNLVTMQWWDDLWLNEGFASYIEYKGQNASHPEWQIDQFFLNDDLHGVIRLDSLDSSHPIIQTVNNPDQITEIFDTISYSKGSSVLRMLEFAISSDVFKDGIIAYLEKYRFGNAKTQHLWNAIQGVLDKNPGTVTNVSKFMDPWTLTKGFPVVSLKRVSENEITVSQQKFLVNSEAMREEDDNLWPIYLTYISAKNSGKYYFDTKEETFKLDDNIDLNSWLKLNDEESGFYIVNYAENDWKLLIELLKTNRNELSPTNRANLIFDASMLAENGLISYELLFDLLSYVKTEDNLIPWMAAQSCLNRLNDKLSASDGGLAMNQYIKELTQNIYSSLGWQFKGRSVESFQEKLLRSRIISLACNSGNQDCLQESQDKFKNFLNTGKQIAPDIREYAYKYGMISSGSDEDWNQIWDLWRTEVSAGEKSKLLNALTSVTNAQLLSKLISNSNDPTVINDQDFFTVQQSIASNSIIGRQLVWNYMRNNWNYLLERFTANDRRLGTYISSVCSAFNSETQLKEMEDFFKQYPESGAGQNARNQAIERVKNNIQWLKSNENTVTEWLDTNSQISNPWLNWRLDSQVIPLAYDIKWNIDLTTDKFDGSVTIEVDVKKPINYFILHSKGLQITESKAYLGNQLSYSKNELLNAKNQSFAYEPNEFWIIPMDNIVRPAAYVLYIEFNGNLSTGLYGLYKSVYTNGADVTQSLATTQFQSTYARRAVPCFDEPQFKSTFKITVTHSDKYTALSNMPAISTSTGPTDDTKVTKFDTSVKMVTYLVALVVSEFECMGSAVDSRIQVCAAPGNQAKLKYALDITPKILSFYEKEYFQIDYPLPKLDNIAIPDFSAGAMENWGLVTYREVYLFFDENESTTRDLMRVCMIISHELAHMWFGNLVTIKFWDDLWLNEGFAQYMSYKAVANVEKDWNYDEMFALDELNRVFDADSTPNTHPILASVKDADDISSVFDAITYGKGASILRMLENALGADNFRTGIKNYLNKYAFQNTLTGDLWTELTQTHPDKLNVSEIMDTWVRRKGFPVVTITRNSSSTKVMLKQELFLKDSSDYQSMYNWKIPVTYKGVGDERLNIEWLDESEKSIELNTESDLVKFNTDQNGLFIVNYPLSDWKRFTQELTDKTSDVIKQLSPLDRSELISDAFYLARSGRLDYEIPLNLSKYLTYEVSLIPWTTAQTMFAFVKNLIYSDANIALNYYINTIIEDQYKKLGWDDLADNAQTRRLRTVIIDMACGYQMPDCLEMAAKKFADFRNDIKIAPNLLSLVLRYGIRESGNSDDFYYLLDKYKTTNSAQEKLLYLQGLTSTTNDKLIQELLANAEDEEFVRKHDYFTMLSNIALNSQSGATMVWEYYRDNYEKIVERFTINSSSLGRLVYTISTQFTTEVQKGYILDFFKAYPNAGAGRLDREKAVEVLDTNIKWLKNYRTKVIEWVTNQCPKEVCPWIVYRLNQQIVPIEYSLTIQVNTTSNDFNGKVNIKVDAKEEVEYFIVHSAEILKITKTEVNDESGKAVEVRQTFRYLPLQFWVIRLAQKSSKARYQLVMEFESNLLLGGMSGLYKSTYTYNNETIGLAASQFQSTSARKAFPCFDEPSFKSEFDITLIHSTFNNLTLSNMPILSQSIDMPSIGWTTTKYQKSVKMVTYLLAFLVSDFVCRSDNRLEYEIRVCASRAKEYKLQYALESTPKVFERFDEYLDYRYQLPKSDLIAIPDFSAGAMENWGLVKFRETALLWTADEDQTSSKMSVNSIIAHELAHMWFGNLLTCEFWGDLWLNEGFASFMEYPATSYAEPSWNYWDLFVYYDLSSAVSSDSSASSLPIVRQIPKPSDMPYSSAIVYNKGATVIRMMEYAMGKDNFRDGIRKYLKKHEYQTVVTQDLWNSLNETFPIDLDTTITELMDNWVRKAGFPYINITRISDNSFTVIQERYLQNGQKPVENTLWTIPLTYYTSFDDRKHNIIPIKTKEQTITVNTEQLTNGLIKWNTEYAGMYFVNYPLEDWDKWIDALVNDKDAIINKLTPSDRAEFILDAFYLAKANKLPQLKPYDLSKYLLNEEHFTPWAMFKSMFDISQRIWMTPYRDSLYRFLSYLTAKQYERLGWTDTDGNDVTKRLRTLIVEISCANGYQNCLNGAYNEFNKWKNLNQSLVPDLRALVLSYGIAYSNDSEDFEFVWNKYIDTDTNLKYSYLSALTYSKDKDLLKKLLDRSLDDRLVSVSHFTSLLQDMSEDDNGLQIVWDFYQNNYEMLTKKLSLTQLTNVFNTICNNFGDIVRRKEVENFLKLYPNIGLSETTRANGLEKIQTNSDWIFQNSDTIGHWLAANGCGSKPCPWSEYRLNPNIKPIKYWPTIQVNVTTNVYNGSVAIEVNATEPVQHFIVHAHSILEVTDSRVFLKSTGDQLPIVKTFRYKSNDFWIIQLAQEVEPNTYRLEYDFKGDLLLGGLSGLYRSTYTKDNETIGLASTQFEFTDARKAFPCFDEPSFKSTFEVTLIHDKHMDTTLSNMPIASTTTDSTLEWVTTKYEETVPMVTYLVAIVVSDFVCNQSTIDEHLVGVCASSVQIHKVDYALESTKKCLHYLAKDYLNISYPLPKVDMIAIPDFSYGAMENWGLVTFREARLLWDADQDTSANKMSVIAVIAHELGHFWFGNLVTCKWWSHFWLNEGFATFMEYKAVSDSEKDWEYFDLFLMSDYMTAVNADSSATSHPLVRTVEEPQDVQQYSSSIVYSKGASVIRMLEFVMNDQNFQKGIQSYLTKNSYSNAVTQDLLDALDEYYPKELGANIFELMDTWTTKAGFPYINITRNADNSLIVTQERFLSNGKQPENETIWTIPLSYYKSFDTQLSKIEFITSKSQVITIETDSSVDGLIKFNADNRGLYFVNYPEEDWNKWTDALVNNKNNLLSKLTPSDRAGFILDAFYLSRANYLPYVRPLQLAKYLVNEKHITPWTIALNSLNQIQKYMFTTEHRDNLMKYFRELAQPLYDELGWDDTVGTVPTRRLRSSIIEFVCSLYHESCLVSALEQYSKWKDGVKLAPNLLTSTLRYAIRQSKDKSDWNYLWTKYMNETSASVKLTYLNALSYTTDPELINLLLNRVLDSNLVRTQDIPTVLNYVASNSDALQILWEFYKQNYQKLIGKISTIQLGTVLNNICQYFTNNSRKLEVEIFLSTNPSLGITNFDQIRVIETINANIEWMSKHKEEIGNFLRCGSDSCAWTTYRLNEKIVPIKYWLDLRINVTEGQFEGKVSIEVETKEDVEYFIVHAADTLNITQTRVFVNNPNEQLVINDTFRYKPFEFWVIRLEKPVPPNSYRLEFEFDSNLSNNMDGLYKSTYIKDGQPVGLAATQFQATSARKAFPCFDEPSFKSRFEVTITSAADMSLTISNMRSHKTVRTISDTEDIQTLHFEETPEMVTYLLALVVSDFVCKGVQNDGYELQVCASSVEAYKLDYSLEVCPKLMSYYAKHFDYAFNLPKVDFIAIPDFSAGAMENWGLITFRETALLWHDSESTSTNRMSVIAVIAHEIVHMWFGNLLTCKWWSDLWLNEAFASYLEYTAVDSVHPDWKYFDLFLMTDYVTAISVDSSATSHPIVRPINAPEERPYTSGIVYQKGASILRMLEFVMGSNPFQLSLQQYLKKYEFKTVLTQQLWNELNFTFPETHNTTIYELMDSWTTKAGFPYLTITRDESTPNTLHVRQDRFLANGDNADDNTLWTIPLSYYTSLDTRSAQIEFIKSKEESIEINSDPSLDGLYKLNTNNEGFYLVNYPEQDWDKWAKALSNNQNGIIEKLTPSDRTNFIIDSFYLARAGRLSYLKPLELSKYLSKETHLTPWSVAISMFAPIRRYLSTSEHKPDLDQYLRGLAQQTYERLGWDDSIPNDVESHVEKRLRSSIVEFICSNNYEPCLQSAQQMYYEWKVNNKLAPNILAPALRYAIRRINLTSDWNQLWDKYMDSTSTVLKLTYLDALAFIPNTNLIKELLDRSTNESLVRKQDYISVLNYVIANPDGLQVMWDYYRTNYPLLNQYMSVGQLGTIVNNMCNHFNDDIRRKEVKEFFDQNPTLGVTASERMRALETVDSNIKWINTNRKLVTNWLKTQTFIAKGTENINIWSKYKNRTQGV